MMKDLCEKCQESEKVFEVADDALGRDISKLTFEGSKEELNLTHNTQPCVLAADLAAWETVRACGIEPDAVAGFSLGEYAALVAAGSLKMDDAFSLIQKRADYMQEAAPLGKGAMAAIGAKTVQEVEELCGRVQGYVVPANLNRPGQTVISGEADAVDEVVGLARAQKIKAMVLPVSAPFHCDILRPAADRLAVALNQINVVSPKVPVYMNVDGEKETDAARITEKLILQATSPVYWERTLRNMYRDGIRVYVELGPGKTLSGFVKKTLRECPDVEIYRVSDVETLLETVKNLRGIR